MSSLERSRDKAIGAGLVSLGLVYGFAAIRLSQHASGPGPGLFPLILAGILCAVSISVIRDGRARDRRVRDAAETEPPHHVTPPARLRGWRRSSWVIVVAVAYVPAFQVLGFFVSTAILTILLALLFGADGTVTLAILGVVVPALLYLLFASALGISLPALPLGLRQS